MVGGNVGRWTWGSPDTGMTLNYRATYPWCGPAFGPPPPPPLDGEDHLGPEKYSSPFWRALASTPGVTVASVLGYEYLIACTSPSIYPAIGILPDGVALRTPAAQGPLPDLFRGAASFAPSLRSLPGRIYVSERPGRAALCVRQYYPCYKLFQMIPVRPFD